MNATGSYRWWYFDALSDDGTRALSAILFCGSVFSPSYASRLRRGERARPEEHVAVNLALYEHGKQISWVMSEYGRDRWKGEVAVADNAIEKSPTGLRLVIHDRSAPFLVSLAGVGSRVEGSLELEPFCGEMAKVNLDAAGKHRWQVQVPRGRVKVKFTKPDFSFEGVGYHDLNEGDARLEAAFSRWSWARFHEGKKTYVLYSAREKSGAARALVVDANDEDRGGPIEVAPGPEGSAKKVGWGLELPSWFSLAEKHRVLRCDPNEFLQVAPFYTRYSATLSDATGRLATGMGEYLDLERFSSKGIQFLLRFKTRRK